MRRLSILAFFAAFLLLTTTGCPSFSTLTTAETVGEGETDVTLSTSLLGLGATADVADETGEESAQSEMGSIPTFEIGVRHGITEDLDLGAKVFPIGAGFDMNYAFINNSDFSMSVNPSLSITRFGSSGESISYGFGFVNLLADVVKTDIMNLTFGLKPGVFYASVGSQGDVMPVVGGMGGLELALSDSFSVMPHFDIVLPISNFESESIGSLTFYNAGLAFHF